MSDDTPRDTGETPEKPELEVAKEIKAAIEEATSIEAEMLEEAAELEEIAEAAVETAEEAIDEGEEALEAERVEEAAELEEIAEDLAAAAHPAPDDAVLASIAAAFPEVRWEQVTPAVAPAQDEAHVPAESLVAFVTAAHEAGYSTFLDLCGVDYLRRTPRFEVVTHLLDPDRPHRLRVRVSAAAGDPVVPSITSVYPGANFYEREAYDLFGIEFTGHPDLTRILMPDDWEGHPLRKDYAVGSVPVQFKGSHKAT